MKSVVVFYSLTNKTRLVAEAIAEVLKADLVAIQEVKPRGKGFMTYFTGGFGAIMNRASQIKPIDIDFKQYDTIFVGSPVWASRPVPAVNAFIYGSNFTGRNVVPFFTMGGNKAGKAVANITPKIGRKLGKVSSSFAVKSYGVSDDELMARARESVKSYLG